MDPLTGVLEEMLCATLWNHCHCLKSVQVRIFLYLVRILENKDLKILRIWRLFTQCVIPIHNNKNSTLCAWKINILLLLILIIMLLLTLNPTLNGRFCVSQIKSSTSEVFLGNGALEICSAFIYKRKPMLKCDFNEVALQLCQNRTSAWVFSCKFSAYFQQLWRAASG